MSIWTTITLCVATPTPGVILDQQTVTPTKYSFKDVQSPWFGGSEGHAEIILCDGYLAIDDKGLRDRSVEEDGDMFLADFRDIVRQCHGEGYLQASDGIDILQIEIYGGAETVTRFVDGYGRFYAYLHPQK